MALDNVIFIFEGVGAELFVVVVVIEEGFADEVLCMLACLIGGL